MRKEKSIVIAYVIWFFVGHFGFHRMYLGRLKTGFLMLGLLITGIALLLVIGVTVEYNQVSDPMLTVLSFASLGMLGAWMLWYVADVVLIAVMMARDKRDDVPQTPAQIESVFK